MKNMKSRTILLVLVFLALISLGVIFSNFYEPGDAELLKVDCEEIFVSPEGNNTNTGDSQENAIRELKYAIQIASPGCTIKVLSGIYEQSAHIDMAKAIHIEGITDDQGNRPVFDGKKQFQTGIEVSGSEDIEIKNLVFKNYTDQGVYVYESKKVLVENVEFYKNGFASKNPDLEGEGFGINVSDCSDMIIRKVSAYHNGPNKERYDRGVVGTGINVYGLIGGLIEDNHAYENIGGGILVEDSERVEVLRNKVERNNADVSHDQWWDAGIWVDGGKDVVVRENEVRDNLGPGIQVSDEDNQSPSGYIIQDNVLEGNYYAFFFWNLNECPYPPSEVGTFAPNTIDLSTKKDILCAETDYASLE